MTSLWLVGAAHAVPASEDSVRETVRPIRSDGQEAEQSHAPDFNEVDTDNSGELQGLARRVAGSDTVNTEKSVPFWLGEASTNYNAPIDNQVSSSGTAAAREGAGQAGHGTMQYALGIEPVIREGAIFGNDYFTVHDAPIQGGAHAYMTPPVDGANWWGAVAQQDANAASRAAFQSSQFDAFYAGVTQ